MARAPDLDFLDGGDQLARHEVVPRSKKGRMSYNGLAATVATDLRTRVCKFLRLYSRARALPDDRTPRLFS